MSKVTEKEFHVIWVNMHLETQEMSKVEHSKSGKLFILGKEPNKFVRKYHVRVQRQ